MTFELADVAAMPVADASTDLLVNALAINHVDDRGPVFAEAVRVLRPGGHLLMSSMVGYFLGSRLSPLLEYNAQGGVGYIPEWNHSTGELLRAALGAGFTVRDCQELIAEVAPGEHQDEPELPESGQPMSIWQLHPWVPVAAHAVRDDRVCLVVWHFQR